MALVRLISETPTSIFGSWRIPDLTSSGHRPGNNFLPILSLGFVGHPRKSAAAVVLSGVQQTDKTNGKPARKAWRNMDKNGKYWGLMEQNEAIRKTQYNIGTGKEIMLVVQLTIPAKHLWTPSEESPPPSFAPLPPF